MATPVMLLSRQLEFGGTERQLSMLALGIDPSLFEVHVGCFHPEGAFGDELRAAGVPVTKFPVRSLRGLSALIGARQMRAYFRRHRIQLVHTFDVPMNVFAVPVARASGVPRVISSQRAQRGLSSPGMRLLLRLSDKMVDGIVTNCEAVRQELIQRYGLRPGLMHLCYNGIDPAMYAPSDRIRPAPVADSSLVVGTVSVLREEKGLQTLLEAFAEVVALDSRLRLAIVGGGPTQDKLRGQADSLGLASRCWFEGATSQVTTWLRGIDLFVLPSLSEALSNSLMEAMACGCCVVASNVGGNPELVKDGETGLLFRAGDARDLSAKLHLLLDRPDLRLRLALAATEYIRRFSAQTMLRRMEHIYCGVLDCAVKGL
jgi:glycosyltransferase involved in cell wall biosynthesis